MRVQPAWIGSLTFWSGLGAVLFSAMAATAGQVTWSDSADLRIKDILIGRVEATIEDGWLHARRFEGDGQLLWHIVLGQARAEEPPMVTAAGGRHSPPSMASSQDPVSPYSPG